MKVLDLDAAAYRRHHLHADDRVWVEKNCYVDIWIELVAALGCDPVAMLPFTVAIDFEDDQWTFFKPPHDELRLLYGIDVQELNCWRPLLEHAAEHLAAGKLVSTEADAFWLPDTSGTDYRHQHTKSTIVINDLDIEAGRMGYFHNAGYFSLEGEDFERSFRIGAAPDPAFMPLFAELVRIDRLLHHSPQTLAQLSAQLLARHVARMPSDDPVQRFAQRFERDLPAIQQRGLDHYHAWAFATVRQLGAAAELAATGLQWLDGGDGRLAPASEAYTRISAGAKTFILKAARAVNSGRGFDARPMFDDWSTAWRQARTTLAGTVG